MKRGWAICPAGRWNPATAADRVLLGSGDRRSRGLAATGEGGTAFLLDLDRPAVLRDGDGIVLDDGSLMLVAAAAEPLLELSARTPADLVRLAWRLGERHVDVQIAGELLLVRRDPELEALAAGLGARALPVEAPFDPEVDVPSHGHHHHGHGHEHGC